MKILKIVELFGGIGAVRKAIINLQIPYKVIDYVEIDKNCVKSYNKLYQENYQPKSVIDYELPNEKIDILMHGSPCQDFSRVGLQKGGEKGSGTRSSLLFETIRIIEHAKHKPKWVIWENVKGVLDKNMRAAFFYYLAEMNRLGYETKYQLLNAKDFGIPQNRERIFAISYLGENNFDFNHLEKKEKKAINEFLEVDCSDKYIVKQASMLKYIQDDKSNKKFKGRLNIVQEFCYTISTKQMRIPNAGIVDLKNGKYRYLTERECFRLMGFSDDDFNKLREIYPEKENKTSSILYKQAGNSIVVDVLEAILKEIFKNKIQLLE
ncbi:DNA (cytosine-5-)-methyltransferase [Gemella sp. zg-570]|uniref:DNA cytosine methyltransferase n=1 Tax=Gemella sp. zg-570 TaxID=2840371 RepID=UPI001C0AEFCC|nr:DNA (cytosine-5-)-methyltransferase [Gemella sp. zg-570]QWQ39563.1 DNA (cytosine-5-)-methyltransferase [Gemella sp. zg-570]